MDLADAEALRERFQPEVDGVPVYHFRTLEEAGRALWLIPGDPKLERVLRRLWSLAAEMAGPSAAPRGVRKYRNIEEANADRQR